MPEPGALLIWVRPWGFLEAASFLNDNAAPRANRACASLAPMLEQKQNKGKRRYFRRRDPRFRVNVVARPPLPKRPTRRHVDKHEPAENRAPRHPPHSAKTIARRSHALQWAAARRR